MLSADQLAAMKATINASFPDSATIQRPSNVSDGAGGWTSAVSTTGPHSCRVDPAGSTANEYMTVDEIFSSSAHIITFPAGTDVRAQDRIVVGARTFEVRGVLSPAAWELSRRAVCLEIE